MKKLIIEIPANTIEASAQLEDGDFAAIQKLAETSSLYVEFGKPHSNPELENIGIAECFAIDVSEFSVKIVESEERSNE